MSDKLLPDQKNTGVAYVLFLFLGGFGIHQFYLKNKQKGIVYLAISLFSFVFIALGTYKAYEGFRDAFPRIGPLMESSGESAEHMAILEAEIEKVLENNEDTFKSSLTYFGFYGFLMMAYIILWFFDLFTLPRQVRRCNEDGQQQGRSDEAA